MSIRTSKMKAVSVLLKRVRTARTILHQRETDESFDGKLEKWMWELNKINDVFMRVKKNEEEMLDTLEEVDGHFRKLDKKRLDQEMDGICKRIRECAHKLLPMDDYDEEDHKSSEILHSSSTQHNNHLLLERYCMLRQQRSVCLLSLLVFPEHAIIKNLSTIYWWIGESYVENTEDKTAEEVGEDVIDELLKLNLIVPYGNAKYPPCQ